MIRRTVFYIALGFLLSIASAQAQSDLTRAYRTIASKSFVDLTHSFGPDTPVWSGFGQAKFSPASDPKTHEPYTIAKDGFRSTYYEMVGQYGTHVDPPAHFAENGDTMDRIPLKQMILPLIVLDDTPYLAKDPNHAFSPDDLKRWERAHGRVPKAASSRCALTCAKTGTQIPSASSAARFRLGARNHQISVRAARRHRHWPRSHGRRYHRQDGFETYILQHGHYQIEVMANLDKVPATGALIVVSWPKVRDGLGFPARAFAIVP